MTKNGCLFVSFWNSHLSLALSKSGWRSWCWPAIYQTLGLGYVWMSGGLGSADLPDSRQASLRSMQRPPGPPGPPSITGVYLVSLVISLCVEKTIRNHEDMTTHSKPFKNGWSDLNIFSNYFNNIGLQCTQGTLGLVNACVRAGRRRCCVSSGSSKENGTEYPQLSTAVNSYRHERKNATV